MINHVYLSIVYVEGAGVRWFVLGHLVKIWALPVVVCVWTQVLSWHGRVGSLGTWVLAHLELDSASACCSLLSCLKEFQMNPT